MAYEGSEIARDNFGKFINQFLPETNTLIRKHERNLSKLYRQHLSLLFNETCFNERLLPNYTHTHTHTHIYIYIYIYIYYCHDNLLLLNYSRKQYTTIQRLYGHLPPISKNNACELLLKQQRWTCKCSSPVEFFQKDHTNSVRSLDVV